MDNQTHLQPKTPSTKGPAELFIGDVYYDVIAHGEVQRVNLVRFAPGAHTAWHRHVKGQTLHVVDGIGRVQSRGGELVELHPGDTSYTPPGEWHWHGAAPSTSWRTSRSGRPTPTPTSRRPPGAST